MPPRHVLVAQSGGPTPVINSSLRGVLDACREQPGAFGRVYGAWHGIEGVLREALLDLGAQDPRELALLDSTPGAGAIGTCRYKLKDAASPDFDRILEVARAHDIGAFFYIGGNDSMDTADKVSRLARARGLDLAVVGIPKTIDNDLGDPDFALIDHTPGYGSAARYWACCIQNANEENAGFRPAGPVLVLQIMGRRAGFLPAAARLGDPRREMPLLIVMAEAGLTLPDLADAVADSVRRHGRCLVALSEGFDVGDLGARRDAFGHIEYGASDRTAQQGVVSFLNDRGLPASGLAFGQVAGTDQRCNAVYASTVDRDEAYQVARHAVAIAGAGGGAMATILREPGPHYAVRFDRVPLAAVANSERTFPAAWLAPSKTDVTDAFVRYAAPLIGEGWAPVPLEGGLQRFARLRPVFAERRCPPYEPALYAARRRAPASGAGGAREARP